MELTDSGIEQQSDDSGKSYGLETIIAYLEKNAAFKEKKASLENFLSRISVDEEGTTFPKLSFTDIIEEDWNQKWKDLYKPLKLTDRITVKPTWEPYKSNANEIVIEIDPGMAFGTGLHESSQLALQLIEHSFAEFSASKLQNILDVGTGTGILGMACTFLGADNVLALDNDPDAVAAALENVSLNGLAGKMTVASTDIFEIKEIFNLIAANITSDVLAHMASQLVTLLAPQGRLILAGILKGEQSENIVSLFCGLGLTLLESPGKNEWQAFLFTKGE